MKNPFFLLGILLMYIFINNLGERGFFAKRNQKLTATSCRSTLVMLEKRTPSDWKLFCEQNNMAIEYPNASNHGSMDALRMHLYRELANNMIFVAKNSPVDSLERTMIIRFKVSHRLMDINAVTEGKDLIKFSLLQSKDLVAEHFQNTVQVREFKKTP